jgi:hypothetical protein
MLWETAGLFKLTHYRGRFVEWLEKPQVIAGWTPLLPGCYTLRLLVADG